MATTATYEKTYKVQGITDAGGDRVNVNFQEVVERPAVTDPNNPVPYNYPVPFNINVTLDEAATYTIGKQFKMTLTAV